MSGSPVKPFGSFCGVAKFNSPCFTCWTPTELVGLPFAIMYRAAAPETCGVAILVPLAYTYVPSFHVDKIQATPPASTASPEDCAPLGRASWPPPSQVGEPPPP